MKTLIKIYIIFFGLSIILGCEDFLEESPVDSFDDNNAIVDAESGQAALDGLYNLFNGLYFSGSLFRSFSNLSDEQTDIDGTDQFSLNSVEPEFIGWIDSWQVINRANHIIEKVPPLESISEDDKNRIVAEAKVIRAMEYLFLSRFWGAVPWTESSDFREVQNLSRTPAPEVLENIVNDLSEAQNGLSTSYDNFNGNRSRIINTAAISLLARAFLYQENWEGAEIQATRVIESPFYNLMTDYRNVFSANSAESILDYFVEEIGADNVADIYLPASLGGGYANRPSLKLQDSFESGDIRRDVSIGIDTDSLVFANKYLQLGENQEVKIIRLAEIFLIRAEARAKLGNLSGALEDINALRVRAGLSNITSTSQEAILMAIEQERFVELCFEGHRWIDIVRTDRANEIMSAFNPSGWDATDILLPIPQSEIDRNPNLSQNPGY